MSKPVSSPRSPRGRRWRATLVPSVIGPWLLASCSTLVSPQPQLLAEAAGSTPAAFAHDDLDAVQRRHVDEHGNVDYAAMQRDSDAIERYYARIAAVSPDSHPGLFPTDAHRLAFWINAYNGTVLMSVTRLYPLASVQDVGVPWYLFFLPDTAGFFYLRQHLIGGERISLYDLENTIIRGRIDDPRIHFALNCASAGCPRLPDRAFRPESLDADLDRETRRFFAEPRNLTVDREQGTVRLSQILEWYASDFVDWLARHGDGETSLLAYAARYAPEDVAAELRGRASGYRIEFTPYDWRLNELGLQR